MKIYISRSRRPPESHLTLNGRIIPFVNSVKYLGVIFDKKVAWKLHTEMIEAKAFRTFIRIYSLFKSEGLSTNIKLTLHKVLIRNKMTYACPAWEFVADNYLLKLQSLQNKILRTMENCQGAHRFAICTWLSNFRTYMIIQNYVGNKQKPYKIMKIQMFATLDKTNPGTGNIKCLNLVAVKYTTVQITRLPL
jgi:hypothetical protein